MSEYKVKFNALSLGATNKYQGDIITEEELQGVDKKRLLDIGAISVKKEIAPVKVGAKASENKPKTSK